MKYGKHLIKMILQSSVFCLVLHAQGESEFGTPRVAAREQKQESYLNAKSIALAGARGALFPGLLYAFGQVGILFYLEKQVHQNDWYVMPAAFVGTCIAGALWDAAGEIIYAQPILHTRLWPTSRHVLVTAGLAGNCFMINQIAQFARNNALALYPFDQLARLMAQSGAFAVVGGLNAVVALVALNIYRSSGEKNSVQESNFLAKGRDT